MRASKQCARVNDARRLKTVLTLSFQTGRKPMRRFSCQICAKSFARGSSDLNHHLTRDHRLVAVPGDPRRGLAAGLRDATDAEVTEARLRL